MPHISVVIPVYKAENCLKELYDRLKSSMETITKDFEIILVEDCSDDSSWNIITELSKKDKRVKGIQFSRNFGQHYGITAGLDNSSGDWVVIMDCDLQDKPEEIPSLYKKALEGYDVVLARRQIRKDPFFKRATSYLFYKVFNYFADSRLDPAVANFRILSKKVVEALNNMRESLRFISCLNDWVGFNTAYIEVEHGEGMGRKSTYNYRKLWKLAKEVIVAYSDKPLKISVNFGFFLSVISFLTGIYYLVKKMYFGIPIQGWTSIIVALFFLGGIIIANLGIIGMYLGKTFDETKKRPLYIVRRYTENVK